MSKQEINKRIDELSSKMFWVRMSDRMTNQDFREIEDCIKEIRKLREML